MPKVQYTQKFRRAWLNDRLLKDWLQVVESTAGEVSKCRYCKQILRNHYNDLETHALTTKHKQNAEIIIEKKTNKQATIPFKMDKDLMATKQAECKLIMFIAVHCSIRVVDHIIPICKNCFKCEASEYLQMHRTKCTAIIVNVLGPYFKNDLINDVRSMSYSLIIDESTDISVIKYLGISIIYFSHKQNKILYSYLDLVPLDSCDAEGIVHALLATLKKYNLSIANMRGIGTDNASVMTGINNGVFKKLKEVAPHLILVRCVCHSLQLAVSSDAKDFLPRNLEFLIREMYNWFSHSTYRQMEYRKIYNVMNDGHDPLKILQSQTKDTNRQPTPIH